MESVKPKSVSQFHLNVSCPDVSPICGTRVAGNRGTHVRHLLLRAHSLVCSLRWTHTRRARVLHVMRAYHDVRTRIHLDAKYASAYYVPTTVACLLDKSRCQIVEILGSSRYNLVRDYAIKRATRRDANLPASYNAIVHNLCFNLYPLNRKKNR